jgi:hypothetical protein
MYIIATSIYPTEDGILQEKGAQIKHLAHNCPRSVAYEKYVTNLPMLGLYAMMFFPDGKPFNRK